MVAASSSARAKGTSMPSHGATRQTKPATISAVIATPAVASTTPGPITGRISENFVSMPPENRMMQRAIMPMNWVISTEWNDMKRRPKSIPTPRKSSSAGAPKR